MKKQLLVASMLLAFAGIAFGQVKASIQAIEGKVEIKDAGSSSWVPAKVGQVVDAGSTISVGIKSAAVLGIADTRINVKALTRLTLRELVEKQGTLSTDMFMSVGKINADVKPVEGMNQTFKVQSPVATASVRGTSFDFDGVTLEVIRGEVAMVNNAGRSVAVQAGEKSVQNPEAPNAAPQSPLASLVESVVVVSDLSATLAPASLVASLPASIALPAMDVMQSILQQTSARPSTATVTINIE